MRGKNWPQNNEDDARLKAFTSYKKCREGVHPVKNATLDVAQLVPEVGGGDGQASRDSAMIDAESTVVGGAPVDQFTGSSATKDGQAGGAEGCASQLSTYLDMARNTSMTFVLLVVQFGRLITTAAPVGP